MKANEVERWATRILDNVAHKRPIESDRVELRMEWPDPKRTAPREPREVVSRGGAWCDWAIDCRLASRRRYLATEHSARVGVRLARTP